MAKKHRKKEAVEEEIVNERVEQTELAELPEENAPRRRWWRPMGLLGVLVLLVVMAYGSFWLVYNGKILPGVGAAGVDLGGLTQAEAVSRIADKAREFQGNVLAIRYGNTVLRVPIKSLDIKYDAPRMAALAYGYGRSGDWHKQLEQQFRALTGRSTRLAAYSYSDDDLAPYLLQISEDVATPVENAKLAFDGGAARVVAAQAGGRLDIGRLTWLIEDHLARADDSEIAAPVYQLPSAISSADLTVALAKAKVYLSAPITLGLGDTFREVTQTDIVGWLKVSQSQPGAFLNTLKLEDIYPASAATGVALDRGAVAAYVVELAKTIDRDAKNAVIAMQDGHLVVLTPSVNGAKLDQPSSVDAVLAALAKKDSSARTANLKITVTRAPVREDNLDTLVIKDLISEGITYFPGSTQARLTNVRTGAARFNGVLLAPGEVFSFGALLGDVGPEQGYVPELVILQDHEEKQYGGGLCQVSSTAFRAALLAGLPILERHNHAFAISYYTAPYGVPGVDATIYYPQIDLKFRNDTPGYILIQTDMQGTTLKFDFYGTKTKTGVIRGPYFVSGSNDSTKPSHTVFYRDVLDLTGKLTGTDAIDTYYQSSKDFPVQKQYN
jgi:vancomycin resistance protein YoaR